MNRINFQYHFGMDNYAVEVSVKHFETGLPKYTAQMALLKLANSREVQKTIFESNVHGTRELKEALGKCHNGLLDNLKREMNDDFSRKKIERALDDLDWSDFKEHIGGDT